ncbi:MAG: hypothetical protein AABY22_01250 [Nanoarchaeota archaeon]
MEILFKSFAFGNPRKQIWFSPNRFKEISGLTTRWKVIVSKKEADRVFHRKIGPAIIRPNCTDWMYKRTPHRNDGPAEVYYDDDKYWHFHGLEIKEEEYWNK